MLWGTTCRIPAVDVALLDSTVLKGMNSVPMLEDSSPLTVESNNKHITCMQISV